MGVNMRYQNLGQARQSRENHPRQRRTWLGQIPWVWLEAPRPDFTWRRSIGDLALTRLARLDGSGDRASAAVPRDPGRDPRDPGLALDPFASGYPKADCFFEPRRVAYLCLSPSLTWCRKQAKGLSKNKVADF
jgi:hypothetical protein